MGPDSAISDLYFDLVAKSVTNAFYQEDYWLTLPAGSSQYAEILADVVGEFKDHPDFERSMMLAVMTPDRLKGYMTMMGRPCHTMGSIGAVQNVRDLLMSIIRDEIPGDFIETGVWRGGLCILAKAAFTAYGQPDRKVFIADSFQGLPEPDRNESLDDAIAYSMARKLNFLAVKRSYVEGLFRQYNLMDDRVHFLEGWFKDTLPNAPIERLAILRLDGDWYESTRDSLVNLYEKISPGGYVIIDDYGLPVGCRRAVDEYREKHGIEEPIQWVDEAVVFWRKKSVRSTRSPASPRAEGP